MPDPLSIGAAGDGEIVFLRAFDAPRARVWTAMTDGALLLRWLWSDDHPMSACGFEARQGGAIRWEWAIRGGGTMGLSGRILRFDPPGRMVHTEMFDADWTGGETVVETRLEDRAGGGTQMTITVRYSSAQARDAALATPMAEGMEEAYRKLDTLLAA